MKSKLHCYRVVAAIIDEDDDGNVVGEQMTEPATVFGQDGLMKWAHEVDTLLKVRSQQLSNPEQPPSIEPQPNRAARRAATKTSGRTA